MKNRVSKHKSRGEVEQYYKLYKRYAGLSWVSSKDLDTIQVPYSEFNRKYKKMMRYLCKKEFRSCVKALNYGKRVDMPTLSEKEWR